VLDEVINMLAAVRDAAAADSYSVLHPRDSEENISTTEGSKSERPLLTTKNECDDDQQQPKEQRRRTTLRPASVASVELRDSDEK